LGDRVNIILVKTQFDGNIGAVARAMLNFGISDLRIVGRDTIWSDETRNRAKHAQKVLDNALSYDTISDAAHDSSLIIGTSGKREFGPKTAFRHFLEPEELPNRLEKIDGKISIVFGPEGIGLLNEELQECDVLLSIPTWEGYPIMNLSHAVAVICYAWSKNSKGNTSERLLSSDLRKQLRVEITKLAKVMPAKDHSRKGIEETLFRVIMRGLPKDDEIHRLLGVIKEASESFEKTSRVAK
jgi:TrmH family RNA methyltransferase